MSTASDTSPAPRPDPAHFPSYRAPSTKSAPTFRNGSLRQRSGSSFVAEVDTYDDVRPGYPAELAQEFLASLADAPLANVPKVLDVGAGTGKFTELFDPAAATVWACDPSGPMCAQLRNRLGVATWQATAEATALPASSVDGVVVAQAWHWVDVPAACAELDRIIRPGGKVLLVWNTLDVHSDPWVLRLARIMHSGDIHKPGFLPEVATPWHVAREWRLNTTHTLRAAQLHDLMHTRAYWLRNGEKIRARMTGNLDWYLYEHTELDPSADVTLPYRCDAFLLERS